MNLIIKKLLYIVLIVAFLSSFISTNAILNPETEFYMISLFGLDFEITTELFDTVNLVASTLTFSALLVIINVINMSNKNTEITQGTLDNKQNFTLANQAWIMKGLLFQVESNNVGNTETKKDLIEAYNNRIPLTVNLSNTFIDFNTVDTETKILNINYTITSLELAISEAKKIGNSATVKSLTVALTKALTTLADLTKKINV